MHTGIDGTRGCMYCTEYMSSMPCMSHVGFDWRGDFFFSCKGLMASLESRELCVFGMTGAMFLFRVLSACKAVLFRFFQPSK